MLASKQCASGYSGAKADVWAAGVLLFVMLLGSFPFDHDEKHDPNSALAAGEVWLKQQQGGWRRNPRAAELLGRKALSEHVCDLLDRLLEMDEVGGAGRVGGAGSSMRRCCTGCCPASMQTTAHMRACVLCERRQLLLAGRLRVQQSTTLLLSCRPAAAAAATLHHDGGRCCCPLLTPRTSASALRSWWPTPGCTCSWMRSRRLPGSGCRASRAR